jgi:hypothetical protein
MHHTYALIAPLAKMYAPKKRFERPYLLHGRQQITGNNP